jgi:hypothetical protein
MGNPRLLPPSHWDSPHPVRTPETAPVNTVRSNASGCTDKPTRFVAILIAEIHISMTSSLEAPAAVDFFSNRGGVR